MKLATRIALHLSSALLPLMVLWGALFYFAMVDEINDEADDALESYSELLIMRMLAGRELPSQNDGSNNSYAFTPLTSEQAARLPHIDYYDADIYIPEMQETEPARILTTVFRDEAGDYYELKVATPTFEREDLIETILTWTIGLYVVLLLLVIASTAWTFYRSLRPLYALLRWIDAYTPGTRPAPVPDDTRITEFRRLNQAMQKAANRSEELFDRQKDFIGNASHELQTPLAIIGNRIDYLIDHTNPSREQLDELSKMNRTLHQAVRLNRTLLLLTRIDNGQFSTTSSVSIAALAEEEIERCREIHASHNIRCNARFDNPLHAEMDESLAVTLVGNLIRNAFVHTHDGGQIEIHTGSHSLTVINDGVAPLDAERIFDRFYRTARPNGGVPGLGLGLALVGAIARQYGLTIDYRFEAGCHRFCVVWP